MFWFSGRDARGILAPRPGIEPAPPALKGEVLTTGLPGKSPDPIIFIHFQGVSGAPLKHPWAPGKETLTHKLMTLLHIPLSELQASRPPPGHLHLQSQRHCTRNGSPKRGISPSVPAQPLPPLTPPRLTQQLHQARALKPGSCLDFSAPDTLCVQSPMVDSHPCVFLKPSSSLRKLPPPPTERLLCGMQPRVPCTHSPCHKHSGLSLKKARSRHPSALSPLWLSTTFISLGAFLSHPCLPLQPVSLRSLSRTVHWPP